MRATVDPIARQRKEDCCSMRLGLEETCGWHVESHPRSFGTVHPPFPMLYLPENQ